MARELRHIPVLAEPVLQILSPLPGCTIVDCTLGLGGHSSLMLRKISPGGTLVAFDFDAANIARASEKIKSLTSDALVHLVHSNFAAIDHQLHALGISQVDGILADLGVASPQIDDPQRGFSYRKPGPLDMRMDTTRGQPASTLINRMAESELRDAMLELGDETDSPKIARLIVERRVPSPIMTTEALTAIICEARDFTLQRAAGAKLHPAARAFQAFRMLVNREIGNLDRLLAVAPALLKPNGIIAIISFHSGEDRPVKHAFRDGLKQGTYSEISEEPIIASEKECQENPRSRSAKLRWARRA